ncbi:hypothetical protein [Ruminococcus sp.]|uniref:hypothetical protein n=1 Tax=Ruminococcus sp. TaxID=41978 RepID=UPI0025DE4ED0|nr:hypothetical protein [Ruminococcus sp.]
MKRITHHLALATATAMLTSSILSSAVWAEDMETVITIKPSKYLTDTAGILNVTVQGGRAIRVKIEKDTLDGNILYYNTLLEEEGTYAFTLDSCEYDLDTSTYDSSFTITVLDEKDTGCAYTQSEQLVPDPGFSLEISRTQYDWNVTSVATAVQTAIAVATPASAVDGIWYGAVDISLEYIPYTLGDINEDTQIDADDAYLALVYYAQASVGLDAKFTDRTSPLAESAAFSAADTTKNLLINADDAYRILLYYAMTSVGSTPSWETLQ